jgi:hypothetical protein
MGRIYRRRESFLRAASHEPMKAQAPLFGWGTPMSVLELESLVRKHWRKYLPEKVKDLRAEGQFEEAVHGAALLAQHQRELVGRFQSSNHMGCPKRPHSVDGRPKMQLSGFMESVV